MEWFVLDLKFCLAFDVGGTFIKYAIVDNSGKIHLKDKVETPGFPAKETIPRTMGNIFDNLRNKFDISCFGISTAGQINVDKGFVEYATDNLPGYSGTDFVETIGKKFNLPVFVDNDVNSAAAGEMWVGSAKETKNFLCVTLGTGVGGAIVINGEIHRGANFSAGEIGHFIIVPEGDKCTCGKYGCYERYASTSALIRMYKEELINSGLQVNDNYTGEYIVDLYYKGDKISKKVYEKFLDYISYGIANLTYILDPGTIIIGGGISAQGKPFFDEINSRFKKYVNETYCKNTVIKQASLLNDAGVIGAAFNAFSSAKII